MNNQTGNKSPRPAIPSSELLQALLAIILAIASQIAIQDDFALLGLAGYVFAALLFINSVGAIFRASTLDEPIQTEAVEVEVAEAVGDASKLGYLRRHWRLVTIAEIFSGDIPPARVPRVEVDEALIGLHVAGAADPVAVEQADVPTPKATEARPAGPPQATAEMQISTGAASLSATTKAVKATAQGNVLVLDTSLEQVQLFDEQGNLLATYSLSGFAGLEVLDLDISPDGKTLYIVDAGSRLRVISLVDEDSAGGEANTS